MRRALLFFCTFALAACDDDPGQLDLPTRGAAREPRPIGPSTAGAEA